MLWKESPTHHQRVLAELGQIYPFTHYELNTKLGQRTGWGGQANLKILSHSSKIELPILSNKVFALMKELENCYTVTYVQGRKTPINHIRQFRLLGDHHCSQQTHTLLLSTRTSLPLSHTADWSFMQLHAYMFFPWGGFCFHTTVTQKPVNICPPLL